MRLNRKESDSMKTNDTQAVDCINLKERFGEKYRISWDEHHVHGGTPDPWTMMVPCKHGHIYPNGDDELGFASDKRGGIARKLASQPFAHIAQDGDDGMNITFDVKHWEQVVKIVKPRLRRRLSEEHKAKSVLNLEAYRAQRMANERFQGPILRSNGSG